MICLHPFPHFPYKIIFIMNLRFRLQNRFFICLDSRRLFPGLPLFFILYFGRRVPGYSFERTVMMFGTCTGTIPTGLILLRMVDSELKTTVSVEAGMWNMAVFIFFYVNFIFHGYVVYGWGMPATLGLFALTFLANYIILRVFKLIGPKQF